MIVHSFDDKVVPAEYGCDIYLNCIETAKEEA